MIRALLAVWLTATLGLLVVTPVPASGASAVPTITVSDSRVRLGKPVTVYGEGPSRRRVVLQVRTMENGWQDIASTATGSRGQYSFRAPGWVGRHRLRVVAPATLLTAAVVSEVRTVTVRMPYRPVGRRADWTWISDPGARWDPCRTITYRINPRGGYHGALVDIKGTFRGVGRVTGFRFHYLGTTTRAVDRDRYDAHPPGTDILVDWQTPRQESALSGRIAGWGGHWVLQDRRFNGYMLLDPTENLPRDTWRQLMTHETGHILGLGHARSPRQLMYRVASRSNRRWGAGDLRALRRVGPLRGCLAPPAARTAPGAGPVRADTA